MRDGDFSPNRRDVDDASRAVAAHVGQGGQNTEERTPEVGAERVFKVGDGHVLEWAHFDDAGVVDENVDGALMIDILKEIRKEQRDHRVLLLQLAEHSRRLEQRMETQFLAVNQRLNHLKDDLELMVKSELLGALTNFQNKIEIYVDQRLAEKAE